MKADLKRASTLLSALQPTTVAERNLNPEQREWLALWRKRQKSLGEMTGHEAATYYAQSLDVERADSDPLRRDIAAIVDPAFIKCRILESDDVESAALKYQEYCQGENRRTRN